MYERCLQKGWLGTNSSADKTTGTLDDTRHRYELEYSNTAPYRVLTVKLGYHIHTPEPNEWLSPIINSERLGFAQKYQSKKKCFWRREIYTDKSTFRTRILRCLNIWRKCGESSRFDCIQFKFHQAQRLFIAWGAIGYRFKSELIILTTNTDAQGFNQKAYTQQLIYGELARVASIFPIWKDCSDYFCIEDNSQVHRKKTTRQNKGLYNAVYIE